MQECFFLQQNVLIWSLFFTGTKPIVQFLLFILTTHEITCRTVKCLRWGTNRMTAFLLQHFTPYQKHWNNVQPCGLINLFLKYNWYLFRSHLIIKSNSTIYSQNNTYFKTSLKNEHTHIYIYGTKIYRSQTEKKTNALSLYSVLYRSIYHSCTLEQSHAVSGLITISLVF